MLSLICGEQTILHAIAQLFQGARDSFSEAFLVVQFVKQGLAGYEVAVVATDLELEDLACQAFVNY